LRQTWHINANAAWQQSAANWENGTAAAVIPDGGELIAAFTNPGAGATRTVTVDGALTPTRPRVMGLDFAGSLSYTLDAINGGEIELLNTFGPTAKITVSNAGGVAGTNRVNVPLVLNDDLVVQNNGGATTVATLELSSIRGTNRSITFAGNGDTALIAASPSFTGSIALTGGKLSLRHGQATNGQPITVSAGALVLRNNDSTDFQSDVTFTGSTVLAVGNGGAGSGQTQSIDDLTVAAGATVSLVRNNGAHFAAADVVINGALSVSVQPGSPAATRFDTLAFAPGVGRMNLNDSPLIVASTPLASVEQMIVSGHNAGAWDGPGLVTVMPDAQTGLTSLGIATADQTGHATFGGVSVSGDDVLIMYTYAGDANLDGFISGDDYTAIDFAVAIPAASGWFNGDFNHDGIISGDDYSTIDFNIVAQGTPFTPSAPVGLTAVPEPGAIAMSLLAGSCLTRRRKR
jgi:hypothetical protein